MERIRVTGHSQISYDILKKYRETAQGIFEIRKSKGQPQETDFEFDVILSAENVEDAKLKFLYHVKYLDKMGIALHLGHLAYITSDIVSFARSFIAEESIPHKILYSNLNLLSRLIKLQEKSAKIAIEIVDKSRGKNFDEYTIITDGPLISAALDGSISVLITSIKSNEHVLPYEIAEEVRYLDLSDLNVIRSLENKLIRITEKAFDGQLLLTVCKTLRDYINECSPLTHPTANLTNDQARVIYETCKIHGLIDLPHEMDIEKVNYIRSVITNKTYQ